MWQYRCFYIDPHDASTREERITAQRNAAAVVRQVSPKPKKVVTIIIGAAEMKCDLDLLQKNTKFFVRGQPGMAYALPANDVSLEAFIIIYKWMAKPNEVVPPKPLMAVYKAAIYLRVQVLLEQFQDEFENPLSAREELGFYIFIGLHQLNVSVSIRKPLRVHKFFLTLIGTNEFQNLWSTALVELLSSSHICVNSEVEVLIAAMLWLVHDYKTRGKHTEELLSCVRFDSIPLEALLQLRAHSPVNGVTELLFRPEFENFLKRAPSHNNNMRYCHRRIWVYDRLCDYHHDPHCPKRNYITFGQFQQFQQVLRNAPNFHWWHRHQLNPYDHGCRNEKCRRRK